MWGSGLGAETDGRCCQGKGAVGAEKGEIGIRRGMHKGNISPKPLAEKMRGVDFYEFLQPMGLRDLSFKGQ